MSREHKAYGEMRPSGRMTWDGEMIFYQMVTVTDDFGNVIRHGERQVLASGQPPPRQLLAYDNTGIL